MAARSLTRNLYDRLVEGYRLAPGNASNAARHAGCERRCARRAWEHGWPQWPWARAIRDVIADEGETARVRAAEIERRRREAEDADREKAHAERQAALTEEANMLTGTRRALLGAAAVSAQAIPGLQALAGYMLDELCTRDPVSGRWAAKPAAAIKAAGVTLKDVVLMHGRFATATSRLAGAVEAIVQLGRTDRGLPNAIIGTAGSDMNYEEALDELRAAKELYDRIHGEGWCPPDVAAHAPPRRGSTATVPPAEDPTKH